MSVVLVPDVKGLLRPDLYKEVIADVDGTFQIGGIAPGSYQLYSFSHVEPRAYFDASFMKQLAGRGVAVEIKPNSNLRVDLKGLN